MIYTDNQYIQNIGMILISFLILSLSLLEVSCHVALIEPPARNVMWRMGFNDLPFHPEDDYLICSEVGHPGCPPCGDNMEAPFPRPHEAGGPWATGIITRTYSVGQVIEVFANVTISHGGFIEFKICPNNDVTVPVKQECLDRHPLQVVGRSSSKIKLRAPFGGTEKIQVKLRLPAGLSCSQCVLQMDQLTDQFLPDHVMFRNCADIEITENSSGRPSKKSRRFK